jgi:hypothetical protein
MYVCLKIAFLKVTGGDLSQMKMGLIISNALARLPMLTHIYTKHSTFIYNCYLLDHPSPFSYSPSLKLI